MSNYEFDIIDGIEVPSLVIKRDETLLGEHRGSVIVEEGAVFLINGTLNGSLTLQGGATAVINGKQNGSANISHNANLEIFGQLNGSVNIDEGGHVLVEIGGRLAGSLNNDGIVTLRGVFGGAQNGYGTIDIDGGHIKKPTIKNGISYYEW